MTKKRNPQDATLRNVRAAHRRDRQLQEHLERDLRLLEARVQGLENWLALVSARVAKLEQPS
jgi:hypothetical protein